MTRLRLHSITALLTLAVGIGAASLVLTADESEQFPHNRHERLFPFCTGCHEGVENGNPAEFYPAPETCNSCHDGTLVRRVEWAGPREHITNLVFDHARHQARSVARDNTPLECERCHSANGPTRMTVERANPTVCLSCHAHRANDHYVDARCQTCHASFVESELPPTRLSTLPRPADHDLPGFLGERHGTQAAASTERCAACHTRERCTACHVNAGEVSQIAAIPAAPGDWQLPAYTIEYPVPPSHLERAWIEQHGAAASRQECATCHTQESCTTCHVQPVPAVIETLPARAATAAPGAVTEREMPLSHASRFFQREHAALASTQPQSCETCHAKQFCSDCHEAPVQPSYHPRNFTAQHANAAYSRRLECASCHEVRTFCRTCHIQLGMETTGRLDPGFHDAEPMWLLRHARAARQGLESCTACHNQRDCLQCHSTLGAFRVSPHGSNFDARRAQQRNPTICFACHVNDPLRGN